MPRPLWLIVALLGPLCPLFAQAPPGYYNSVNTSSAAALRASLHAVIDDHTRFPFTSTATDTWDILELADQHPANAAQILDVYKNAAYPKAGGGNPNYDREHSWPSSYGFPNDASTVYPFSDCHALFLSDSSYNSDRSNKPFRNCNPSCSERITNVNNGVGGGFGVYPGQSNWTSGFGTSGTWEVWTDRRGDIARAQLYMDVRYEGGFHGVTGAPEPDLILTDNELLIAASNTGTNESLAYMGILSVLLQWHQQDPPSARELDRNDVVFSFQGNRNPFVDHPEWVAILFGGGSPTNANLWINELHYDNAGADVGEGVELAGAAGLNLAGFKLVGYNGTNGDSYATLDLTGQMPDLGGCLGVLNFPFPGLQNGFPDGIALVDPLGNALQFLSYGGTFLATGGPAIGQTSVDLGVMETGTTLVGQSLQLVGVGTSAAAFSWSGPSAASPGLANPGQTLLDACSGPQPPPAPTGLSGQSCSGLVGLSWNPVTSAQLQGYEVYRSTVSGSGYQNLTGAPVQTTSFVDSGPTAGIQYFYVISAVDALGGEGPTGAEFQITAQGSAVQSTPWINEFHYDNLSTDIGEFVEVAGPAGLDLTGYSLVAYNGANGLQYQTIGLFGVLPDQGGCVGALAFPFAGLQNGSPDGIALIAPAGAVLDALAYEGSFSALDGPAMGTLFPDIGVSEPTNSPVSQSLQRSGVGSSVGAFSLWQAPLAETPGAVNSGQAFQGGCPGSFQTFGCGFNPPGSLSLLSGSPLVGGQLQVGLDDPLGVVPTGSVPILILSFGVQPNFPCGIPIPGLGLAGPLAVGELSIDLNPALTPLPIFVGSSWVQGGPPIPIALSIPLNCNLAGAVFFLQGAFVDAFQGYGTGLTEAARVELAP